MPANTPPGPATDASGQSVVDPSLNVKELQEASIRRIDDLAGLRAELARMHADCSSEVATLRAEHGETVATLRSEYTEKIATIRENHMLTMQEKEAERLNAIRDVDAASARETASAAEARAITLAGQVQSAADAMRTTVDNARVAASESQAIALQPIQEGLAAVQRFQYEAVGQKTQVVETQAKSGNSAVMIGLAVAVVGLLITLVFGIAGLVVALLLQGS